MKTLKNNFPALSMLISIVILGLFYKVFNNANNGVNNLVTDLDNDIPLISMFVIPYILWYGFIFLSLIYFCFNDKKIYYSTIISYNIGLVFCYLVYFFYQTTVPRPEIIGNDFFSNLLRFIYSSDEPFNCFPSIHCYTCALMMKALSKSSIKNKTNRLLIYGLGIMIIVSTLLIKQHVILDAISAILLSDLIFTLVHKINWESVLLWIRKLYLLLTMKKKLEI